MILTVIYDFFLLKMKLNVNLIFEIVSKRWKKIWEMKNFEN